MQYDERQGDTGAPARDTAEPAVRQDARVGRRVHAPAAGAGEDAAAVAHAATHQGGNSFAHRFNPIPHVHCIFVCSHAGTSTARFARCDRGT